MSTLKSLCSKLEVLWWMGILVSDFSYCDDFCGPHFRSPRELIQCIELNSPRILRAKAIDQESIALPKQAHQWQNPTLNLQTVYAAPDNPNGSNVEASILFPLDFSGVQKARTKKAQLEVKERHVLGLIERQEVLRLNYLSLHRIRQLNSRIEVLEETVRSLKSRVHDFQIRPSLTPEQIVSRETFTLAIQDAQSRLSLLQQECHALVHDIEIEINSVWSPNPQNLPKSPRAWPTLSQLSELPDSPAKTRFSVMVQKEEANISVLRAEKRPVLSVGPFLGWSKLASTSGIQAGLVLQMPLPIIESYSGSIELADRGLVRVRALFETGIRETQGEFNHNREIYEESIISLSRIESILTSKDRVKRVEKLFKRGLISSTSYLGILQQDLLLREVRDELESRAINAWCILQGLQNQFEECFL